jgi:hypothetical protein
MPVRGRSHTIQIWSLSSQMILKENWESETGARPAAPAVAGAPA